ncbi:B12-binding domain-containing radical SAM protein [Actinophytocola oryzae]|uniref:Radical SAM family protein n=1 Tax=Actinophytocola oryzae TaxID=502181 RepID=A0A4R7V1S9_9PSEU|nr:cobalamin-dependent protein [Actinophytocola oryzae]TDV43219.1 radical SAM family protein [Actinophytocola oryzae]
MRLTLVQPPNGFLDYYDLAPPLGLLTLAAVVRQDGVVPALLDLNLRGMQDPTLFGDEFHERTVEMILETTPDVVGFTSMALESHVCLELARLLKERRPELVTVFGGPHFSSIARQTLEYYPWTDYVVTGEGERAIRGLVRHLRGEAEPPTNVCFRRDGEIVLRRELKTIEGLDEEVPFAAYDLVDLDEYFALNPLRLLNFDSGRGCIFRCSFCYSPGFWGQGEQVRSPGGVAEDVTRLHAMGARHLFFVQDNLVNSVANTLELCTALIEADTGMTWNAYTTMQRLTPELLDPLAAAGCTEVFVGVDAVSTEAQAAFGKHFFKGWSSLRKRLTDCLDRGIVPTCAFMVDVPQDGDHANTDAVLTTALLTRNLGCGIRLNTLTVYNDTITEKQFAGHPRHYSELKPRLLLDTPPAVYRNEYAREHPELFPFHSTLLDLPVYERFATAMHLAYTLFTSFQRTLLQYVVTDGQSPWLLLERIADLVGDLVPVPARERRQLERTVFEREFRELTVSTRTREAFELESAELTLSLSPPGADVQVLSAGERRWYTPEPYEVIRLSEPLATLSRDDGAARVEKPGNYLVLREGGQLRYFLVNDELVGELNRIGQAGTGRAAVELSAGALSDLTTAGVLKPMKEVR